MPNADRLLQRAQRKARRVTVDDRRIANIRRFRQIGLDADDIVRMAQSVGLEADDLLLMDTHVPLESSSSLANSFPVEVDIENEAVTFKGKTFDIDQQVAAVLKCLLDANGERRSQNDMRRAYPRYIVDQRLDDTIRRKLVRHKSGVGTFIKSDTRGYWLDQSMSDE